jgi:hypothetical protein
VPGARLDRPGEEARRKVPPWGRGLRPADRPALARSLGREIEVSVIDVPTVFRDFDDYWSPFLGGQAPAPGYAMSLGRERRAALREHIRVGLPTNQPGGGAPPHRPRLGGAGRPPKTPRIVQKGLPDVISPQGARVPTVVGPVAGLSTDDPPRTMRWLQLPRTLPLRTRVNRASGTFESPMFRKRG